MQRSDTKILTTHVGSLPGRGESGHETPDVAAIREIIAAQQAAGLDIVNEGEFTKGGDWLSFIDGRLGGFTSAPRPVRRCCFRARTARPSPTSTNTPPSAARCSLSPRKSPR